MWNCRLWNCVKTPQCDGSIFPIVLSVRIEIIPIFGTVIYRKSGNFEKDCFHSSNFGFFFSPCGPDDYLEPVRSFSTYKGELGEYYRSVFSLLNTGFQKQPYARFTAIPSFSPEICHVGRKEEYGRYFLISNTLSRTYWQAEKGTVKVETKSVAVSPSLYRSLGAIFHIATEQIQDLDGSSAGLDGVVYYFSSTNEKGKERMGQEVVSEKGTLMERLVLVCQSAYMLSKGGNISEQTLAEEAALC